MARPRIFDADVALEQAQTLFWSQGYRATSLDDITAATGVNKPSLYAAFGDKEAMFRKVLERYHARLLAYAGKTLGTGGLAAIGRWLASFIPACSGANGTRGCLSINTLREAREISAAVTADLAAYESSVLGHLQGALERARSAGEIAAGADAARLARMVYTYYSGMFVLGQQQPDAGATRHAVSAFVTALGLYGRADGA